MGGPAQRGRELGEGARWFPDEGKRVGSRRRLGSPTDSNATLDGAVGDEESRVAREELAVGDKYEVGREAIAGSGGQATQATKKKKPELTIVSGNGGGWGRIKEFLQQDREAAGGRRGDIFLAQEHHVGSQGLEEGLAWCKKEGWKALASAATGTEAGGNQGGVMLACRPRIGVGYAPGETTATLVPGRLMACHVNALCKGGLVVYNVYLWTSEGLSHRNVQILEAVLAHKAGHRKPWVLGGDFQIEAKAMQESIWPRNLDAVVVAPPGPTCMSKGGGSTIDYFMVDRRVKRFFGAAETLLDGPFKPHHPVQVVAVGGWHRETAHYLKKPKAFPKKRLVGPNPVGQEWGPLKEEAREALGGQVGGGNLGEGVMNSLWRRWSILAGRKKVANLGIGGRGREACGEA